MGWRSVLFLSLLSVITALKEFREAPSSFESAAYEWLRPKDRLPVLVNNKGTPSRLKIVIAANSHYYHNYRHAVNALALYRLVKWLGVPDSDVSLISPKSVCVCVWVGACVLCWSVRVHMCACVWIHVVLRTSVSVCGVANEIIHIYI